MPLAAYSPTKVKAGALKHRTKNAIAQWHNMMMPKMLPSTEIVKRGLVEDENEKLRKSGQVGRHLIFNR